MEKIFENLDDSAQLACTYLSDGTQKQRREVTTFI